MKKNIEWYIKKTNFSKIIFGENSRFTFEAKKFEDMALKYRKSFEYLDLSSTAAKDNISIGDAQIIRDALETSELISEDKGNQFKW